MSPEPTPPDGFTLACLTSEVPVVMPRKVMIAGRALLICRDQERFFAVDELCPHKNESMAYGVVMDGKLICPHHQYAFNLETGRCQVRRCAPVQTYETLELDGAIYVKLATL